MTQTKTTRRLPRVFYCDFVEGHVCTLSHGQKCPEGCKLPHRCETCGNASCINFDSFDSIDNAYCWIPPYWWDKYDYTDPEEDEGGEE